MSITIPTATLKTRRAELMRIVESGASLPLRRITKDGFEYYFADHAHLQKEIASLDEELLRRKEEKRKRKQDFNDGHIVKAKGAAAVEFLEMQAKASMLDGSTGLIVKGQKQAKADKARKESNIKEGRQCPQDHFRAHIFSDAVEYLRERNLKTRQLVEAIGLFIQHGPHKTDLNYTGKSLSSAFTVATAVVIAPRTWQAWSLSKISAPSKDRKILLRLRERRYQEVFKDFLK